MLKREPLFLLHFVFLFILTCFSELSHVSIAGINSSCNLKKIINNRKRKYGLKYALRNLGSLGNTLESPREQSPRSVNQWGDTKGEAERTRCQASWSVDQFLSESFSKVNANDLNSTFPSLGHADPQPALLRNLMVSVSNWSPPLEVGHLYEAKSGNVHAPGYSAKSLAGDQLPEEKVNQETSG